MVKLGTSCKECLNFDKDIKSCNKNLYSVFSERQAEITYLDDDVTIDRICPYKSTSEQSNHEVYIFGTVVLIAKDKDQLQATLQKLNKNKNIDRFKILILYKNIKYHELTPICIGNIRSSYKIIHIATDDLPFQVYKSLSFAKNGLLFILECDKDFEDNMIDKVNHMINKDLYRVLHIHNNDNMHGSVSMLHIYKWIKGHLGDSMSVKLNNIADHEKSDAQVYTWKEVNEKYSN